MKSRFAPVVPQAWRDHWRDSPVQNPELSQLLREHFNPDLVFCAGPYFFWLIDLEHPFNILHVQGNIEQITGYPSEFFLGKGVAEMHQVAVPPEETPVLLNFSQYCLDFLANLAPAERNRFKFSFYFNILHRSGRLVPVVQQDSIWADAWGIPRYLFTFITDISHLKAKNDLMFTILTIGEDGSQQFRWYSPAQPGVPQGGGEPLSARERQIVGGLAQGLGSKQIAAELGLAFHTVNTHRQRMLAKTGCKNSAELVRYALERGLV
ncbi:MAG: LuxR C-terminal-related transcriptional regulator [Bernardetiaceae bacterium]|jgi:DNA-binding CsgD family transcriptional regulator|nr:LuxR C-terminal-related transcriptional regulator [Bernardetiaceae bacterium]